MIERKKVLGKGLGALIGEVGGAKEGFTFCAIRDIAPNSSQPRKSFNSASLKELAESIKEKGVIEPLLVRERSGGFELVAGERRLRAAKMAGLEKVPVVIISATDRESLEYAIIENIQREDLNPLEEAEAFKALTGFGLSQEEVAKKVGKERATVANYLRLLKLPPEVKDELARGTISMGHARAIVSIDGHAAQRELCRRVIKKALSVRQTEDLAARMRKGLTADKSPGGGKGAGAADLNPLEEELRQIFGTKVTVKDRNGRGKIEINFYSKEERERIIELLKGGG